MTPETAKTRMSRSAATLIVAIALCCGTAFGQDEAPAAAAPPIPKKENYVIAIVRDGDSEYFDRGVENWKKQLKDLASGYEFSVKDEFNAGNENAQVVTLLKQALADPEVDMVYAAGVVATERAAKLEDAERTKPIMAGSLQFSDERGQPISESGTSKLKNYTFITSPQRVSADIDLLKDLTGADTLHVLIESRIIAELTNLEEAKAALKKKHGVTLKIVGANRTAAATLTGLPGGIKAMYVSLLPGMSDNERKKLYAGLAAKKIPVVSMFGKPDVEFGAMAGLAPDNADAVARLTALNIHQLLRQATTASLPVYLPVQDYFVINAATAQRTGWSPDYDTVLAADFIDEALPASAKSLSLHEAMRMARKDNADVAIAGEDVAINDQDIKIARSLLLPQAAVLGELGRTSFSSKIDPLGPGYVHAGTYGVQIRQVLFSDEFNSDLKAQRKVAAASRFDNLSIEYDAMEAAAFSFFNFLSTEALYKVEKENLRLTTNNLRMAQLRVSIGAAQESEIYRWQQDLASDRATLFQRESERNNALVELNRILGAPREATWRVDPIKLAEDDFFFMNEVLQTRIKRQDDFRKFGAFLQLVATESSPELVAFDLSLAAQGITLGQKQRRFFLPEASGFARYDRAVSGSDLSSTDGQNEGTVGLQFSYPLFEGGRRKAEVQRQKAVIRQVAAQREKALQLIEQRALNAVHGISATHPNIRLSRLGLKAAELNYASNVEKYSQGAASILDLLDAQRALLSERQQSEVADYAYLQQIYRLQRAISWFEFEKSPEDKRHWARLLETFMRGGSVFTSNGKYPKATPAANAKSDAERAIDRAVAAPKAVPAPKAVAAARPKQEAAPKKDPKPKKRRSFFGRRR